MSEMYASHRRRSTAWEETAATENQCCKGNSCSVNVWLQSASHSTHTPLYATPPAAPSPLPSAQATARRVPASTLPPPLLCLCLVDRRSVGALSSLAFVSVCNSSLLGWSIPSLKSVFFLLLNRIHRIHLLLRSVCLGLECCVVPC
jgi:hypothetical protein